MYKFIIWLLFKFWYFIFLQIFDSRAVNAISTHVLGRPQTPILLRIK